MAIVSLPNYYRSPGTANLNWASRFSQGLCFLWSATGPVAIPRDSVRNTVAAFSLGSASGWSVVTDPKAGRVMQSDGSNTLLWPDADFYHKPSTGNTALFRANLSPFPISHAGIQFRGGMGFSWDNSQTTPSFYNYTQGTINGGLFSQVATGPTYGSWFTWAARFDSAQQIISSSVFNDDGELVGDATNGVASPDTISYVFADGPHIDGVAGLWDFWGLWNYCMPNESIAELINTRTYLASTPLRTIYLLAGSLTVPVSLSQVVATGSLGLITVTTNTSTSKNLTAVVATGSVGTLTPQNGANISLTGVSATSSVGTVNVSIAARLLTAYPNTTSLPVPITLDNLANGSARQSAALFNSKHYDDVIIRLEAVGTAFAAGPVDIYAYGASDLSNFIYTDNCTGQDAVFTPPVLNAVYVGSVKVNGAVTSIGSPTSLAAAFGGEIPDSWGIIIYNRTGAVLGTGNVLSYQGKWLAYSATSFAILAQSANLGGLPASGNIGILNISNANYVAPTKQGYQLSRDYTAGSTIVTNTDITNNFYYYPYPVSTLGAPVPAAIAGLGYGLVFDDDFNSLDIGTSGAHKWYYYPWSESLPPAANVSAANGVLNLKWTQGQTNNDTSISTVAYDRSQGQGWYLGYFEFSMKWDVIAGAAPTVGGISLAHVLGTDVISGVEHFATIDAASLNASATTTLQGISTYSVGNYPSYTVTSYDNSSSVTAFASTDFHKYGFLWTTGNVAVYLDDVFQFNMATNADTDAKRDAQALVLSAAWDGVHGPGNATLNVYVHYVRVWQLGVASPILLQGNDWEQFSNSNSNLSVSGTNMLLTATLPTGTTGFNVSRQICTPSNLPINSGLIQSIYTQYYGYYEANVQVQKSRGGNPRFYLTTVAGQIRPEIVAAEWPNNGTLTTTSSIHPAYPADGAASTYSNTSSNYNTTTDVYSPGFDYSLGFHVVGIDWNPGLLTTYVDGVLITSKTFNWVTNTGADPGPAAAVLVMAIGTSYGGDPQSPSDFPQVLKINYLRIWQKNPVAPTTVVQPNQGGTNLFGTQDLTQFTAFSMPPSQTSANGATATPGAGTLIDSSGNTWAVTNAGVITENGVSDATTNSVVLILWYNGLIYQNAHGLWWSWSGSPPSWVSVSGDPRTSSASANGATITPGSGSLTDNLGNVWTVTAGGVVAENGVQDTTTNSVTLLLWYNGLIYQTAFGFWWSWSGTAWTPVSGDPRTGTGVTAPTQASAAGYNTLSFVDEFTTITTIDVNATQAAGFNWYPKNFFGVNTASGNYSVANSVLTISNDTSGFGLGLASATDIGGNAYRGQVFSVGFYVEASMAFDPSLSNSSFASWPAFWSMAISHCALGVNTNFSEIDFFEAYPQNSGSIVPLFANHHWVSVNNGFFNAASDEPTLPGGVDFTAFHTYGTLVIPRSANGGTGIVRRYFDNALLSTTILNYTATGTSSDASGVTGSPGAVPAGVYSIFDTDQHAIMLGTGPNWPVRFDWVRIWKAP